MSPLRAAALHVALGAWLALIAASAISAISAFGAAGDAEARGGLRWAAREQAGETNARVFAIAGRVQIVLAGIALACAAWPPRPPRSVVVPVALAGLAALALAAWLGPAIGNRGPHDLPVGLHRAYGGLTLTEIALLGVAIASSLIATRRGLVTTQRAGATSSSAR